MGYFSPMCRAVFTLLVGLILSLGAGTSAFSNQNYASWSDKKICHEAVFLGEWSTNLRNKFIVREAKRRGLSCGLKNDQVAQQHYEGVSDREVCIDATYKDNQGNRHWIECLDCGHSGAAGVAASALKEARRRGLNCESEQNTVSATEVQKPLDGYINSTKYASWSDEAICNDATFLGEWSKNSRNKFRGCPR